VTSLILAKGKPAVRKDYVRQQGGGGFEGKDPRYLTDADKMQLEQTKKRRNNRGRGIEGKYVFKMEHLSKFIEGDKPLFEDLNLQIWAGYVKNSRLGNPGPNLTFL